MTNTDIRVNTYHLWVRLKKIIIKKSPYKKQKRSN